MSIHLFGDYYFDRDKFNWILQVKKFSKKKQEYVIKNLAYFGNPKQMAEYIAQDAALRAVIPTNSMSALIQQIDMIRDSASHIILLRSNAA